MTDPFDMPHLGDIPDPFAADEAAPPPPARSPSPARSRVRTARALALLAAFAYQAAWIAHLRVHAAGRAPGMIALELLLPLAACIAAWMTATRAGRRGLGEATVRLAALTVALPLAFAVLTSALWPSEPHDGAFWQHAWGCMVSGALFTMGPLVLVAIAFRHGFAAASAWRAAAVGVACGALATATLALVCPLATAGHLIVGHGAAFLLSGLAGGLLGRRILLA